MKLITYNLRVKRHFTKFKFCNSFFVRHNAVRASMNRPGTRHPLPCLDN